MAKLDKILIVVLIAGLVLSFSKLAPDEFSRAFLIVISGLATIPVILSAADSLKNKKVSVDLLASIALVASLAAREWTSAVFINLMLTSARLLQSYAQDRASYAIESLLKLRPNKVKVKRGERIFEESVSKLKVGDLIVIESGERIPVDGIIETGDASIDQSSLTGESVPVSKSKGDKIFSSTLNVSGSLTVKTEKVGKETMLEKIIDLVEKAQEAKPGINTIAERFTGWYIFLIFVGSVLIYALSRNFTLLLSVLLVACADDIAVAIPIAFLVSIGRTAKEGIIIKGGNFLEGLTKIKTMVVDKTGTLTRGKMSVDKVVAFGDFSHDFVIRLAATAEFFSEHPAAKAITHYAKSKKIEFQKPTEFNESPGRGSTASYKETKIITGKLSFLQESGVKISAHQSEEISKIKNRGLNTTLVGYGDQLIGVVALADEVRPEIKGTIAKLRKMGVRHWIMLTGDNEKVARRIADTVGITEFHANLLPEDKLDYIKKHLNKKSKLAMVGDGVNDAAALAISDIGIAMGAIGSDAAIEAADVALMKDDFSKIPDIIRAGKRTMRISYQDFAIWGIVNAVGLFLVFAKFIGPEGAAAYNFITDFFPLINSVRLFRMR